MKRLYRYLMIAVLAALASCQEQPVETENIPAINVTSEKLVPAADDSGTVRAYAGDQVTAKGLNLDKVGKVTVDGVEAKIVEKTMKTLVFEIPVLDKAQRDEPYMVDLEVFEESEGKLIFKYDYFVTVPVIDAIVNGIDPKAGTVGTAVTVSGRNLLRVSAVSFGGVSVDSSKFVSKDAGALVVAVPAVSVTGADTELDVTAVWDGGTIALTDKFTLSVPVFDAYTQTAPAALGDEVVLAGKNLNLVSAVKWGDDELLIAEQSATSITVKVPSGLDKQDPAVVSKTLTAIFGVAADQTVTVLAAFQVDTTPIGPAAPVFGSAVPADAGYEGFYLGRTVTVKGENFASIEKFEIDGKEVALVSAATDIQAQFVIPSTISGTAAKDVTLTAVWNGGNKADFGTIKVHPFYYHKGLRLRIGSNSASTYPEENSAEAFLLLDEGKVVSVADFKAQNVDPYALSGTNTVVTSANKAAAGKETEYYSVQPYTFAIANSSHKLSFCDPGNSNSQLKTHRDGSTALPGTFGTPIIYFVVVSDADLVSAVTNGKLDDIATSVAKAGKAAPAYSTDWTKGSVLGLQYVDYTTAAAAGKPADNLGGVRKVGYLVVTDITCVSGTGASTDRKGYIDFDYYWSNVL